MSVSGERILVPLMLRVLGLGFMLNVYHFFSACVACGKSQAIHMDFNLRLCPRVCGFTVKVKDTHKCCPVCPGWKQAEAALARASSCDRCHRLNEDFVVR